LTDPDTFVSPRRWFGEELRELIRTALVEDDSKAPVPPQIKAKLRKIFEEINERNEIIDDRQALTSGHFKKDETDSEPSTLTKVMNENTLIYRYFSQSCHSLE
jgi:hypothetical protein